jgi:hypothetical protein
MSNETIATSAAAQSGMGSNVAAFTGQPGLPIDVSTARRLMKPMPPKSRPRRPLVVAVICLDA